MICVDTMVLIWGIQKKASKTQQEMIGRTGRWLRSLPSNQRVMVPSVVVAEFLLKFRGPEKARYLRALEANFYIPSLDLPSAALAADLRSRAKSIGGHIDREVIKSDCYILATAIVHGASAIVTENRSDFLKLCGGRIRIESIPEIPEQMDLAGDLPTVVKRPRKKR